MGPDGPAVIYPDWELPGTAGNDTLTSGLLSGDDLNASSASGPGSSGSPDSSGVSFGGPTSGFTGGASPIRLGGPGGLIFAHGGLSSGSGGGGHGILRGIYSRRNLRRLDLALPKLVGPLSALTLPAQTLSNAPPLNTEFTRSQLGGLASVGHGEEGLTDGGYYNRTIYLARETLAAQNPNFPAEIYFHELGNHLSFILTKNPKYFGRKLRDPDTGFQLYKLMFGDVIPIP